MKKLLAATALTGVLFSGAASAQGLFDASNSQTYVAAGYEYFDGSGASLNGGSVALGHRFSKYFGAEIGGQFASKSGVDLTGGYVEAQGILPLTNNLSLIASLGGSYANASTKVGPINVSVDGTGIRVGGALEYDFSPNWGVRAGYHYQDALSGVSNVSIGLKFGF